RGAPDSAGLGWAGLRLAVGYFGFAVGFFVLAVGFFAFAVRFFAFAVGFFALSVLERACGDGRLAVDGAVRWRWGCLLNFDPGVASQRRLAGRHARVGDGLQRDARGWGRR